jgi:nuclear pore complex protein Nup98-Nup96
MDQNNMNKFFNSSFFAQTPQKNEKQNVFQPGTQPSVFGQQSPFGATGSNPFVQPSTAGAELGTGTAGTSPFGAATQNVFSSTSSQPTAGRFGSAGPFGTGFGTATNTGFGAAGGAPFSSSNAFTSGFSTQTTSPFGATRPSTMGLPGSTAGTQGSLWDNKPSTVAYNPYSTTSSLLGSRPATAEAKPLFSSFGAQRTGTKDKPYEPRKIREDSGLEMQLVHINGNLGFTDKSIDELRMEDYNLGRKPAVGAPAPTPLSGFTTGLPATQPSIFSSSTLTTAPAPFQPLRAAEIKPTSLFPMAKEPAAPLFGPQTGAPVPTSLFNTTSSLSQPSFGIQPPAQPTSFSSAFTAVPSQPVSTSPFSMAATQAPSLPSTGLMNQSMAFPSSTLAASAPGQAFLASQTLPLPSQPAQSLFPSTVFPSSQVFQAAPADTPSQSLVQQPSKIDLSDPFLIKDVKFEKTEKEHIPMKRFLPQPIFREEPSMSKIKLNFRPPKSPVKEKVYTIPSIDEIKHMKEVHNLVIGFEDKGRIEYLDTVNASEVTMANIESKIFFSRQDVVVNDPVGIGLNRRARVYVEGVFPYSKSLGDYIRGEQKMFPLKGIQERFLYGLKHDPTKQFVGYEHERGTYVYDVNHF